MRGVPPGAVGMTDPAVTGVEVELSDMFVLKESADER
jgi:hypothetical protein